MGPLNDGKRNKAVFGCSTADSNPALESDQLCSPRAKAFATPLASINPRSFSGSVEIDMNRRPSTPS
jgi:hypothetical protein